MHLHDVLAQRRTHAIEELLVAPKLDWLHDIGLCDAEDIVDVVIAALLAKGDPRIVTVHEFGSDSDIVIAIDADQYRPAGSPYYDEDTHGPSPRGGGRETAASLAAV